MIERTIQWLRYETNKHDYENPSSLVTCTTPFVSYGRDCTGLF